MPKMDGWEFRKHQLSHPSFSEIPVLVVSAVDAKRQAERLGAIDGLPKPFRLEDLCRTVAEFCGGRA